MENPTRIVVLGGGYGGVRVARKLVKRLGHRPDVKITLIDKNTFHTLMTELHEVAAHRAEPESVQVSFRKIFGGRNIDIVTDRIEKVDFQGQKLVSIRGTEYPYDYLVLGSGAEPDYFGIPGIQENSMTLWSFDDAMRIRHHLAEAFRHAENELDPDKRRKLLTFVVAGAGFTGFELAGEILQYRDVMCAKYRIPRSDSRVVVVEALPVILQNMEEPLRKKAETYFRKHGGELLLNAPIVGAEPGVVKLKDGSVIETESFMWTCGVKASSFAAGLGLQLGKRGRIVVTDEMQAADYRNVFVVGDNGWFLENEKPLPQIVETADQTADTAAHNIVADIEGGTREHFKSNYHGFMVCVGGKWGVSNAGGIRLSGFLAIAMKHLINLWYLFNVAGVNPCWEYAKHEFLDIKDNRSLIGGFAAYRIRGYWPLLLRLWLGFMWVTESVNKITEGWLDFASGSKTSFMFSKGVVQAGVKAGADATAAATQAAAAAPAAADATAAATQAAGAAVQTGAKYAADATAAATQAAGAAVQAVTAATGQAAAGGADATAAATAAAGQAAGHAAKAAYTWFDTTKSILSPDAGIVVWFRHVFMDGLFAQMPYSTLQVFIVITEAIVGLGLLGGFFTWWAAVISIGMCLVFTLSGLFAWNQAWFFFAGILMMGGAGRAFGLDCWSVPFFKRLWNGTKFARKRHLYLDEPTK
jgi:NADH:ubiquinone reductase (H+-translocating)